MSKPGLYIMNKDSTHFYKTYSEDDQINGKILCYEIDPDTHRELIPQVRVLIHCSKLYGVGSFD